MKNLEQVAAYLDDVIVFDSDPTVHVKTMRALFEHLRKHNLKLSASKVRLGATDADFLGHSISPAGVRPNAENMSALIKMSMPQDLKQVRGLLGGVGYHRKLLRNLPKQIRPITSLLRKGVTFEFTPAMEVIVHEILTELTSPPILVFPDWDTVADGSCRFHVYCDAYIDGFGAAIEHEQSNGSVRPIACISTLPSIPRGSGLRSTWKLAAIVWAIKRLRGYFWGTKFRIFSVPKELESIGKVVDHNARVQRWLEFLPAFDYALEYRKGNANGKADFLSRLPEPATEHDGSGYSSLTPVNDGGISVIWPCGLHTRSSPTPVLVWVGWCPAPRAMFWPLRIFAIFARTGHV